MNTKIYGTKTPEIALISDDEYFTAVQNIISGSKNICFASLFIVDLKTGSLDRDLKVYQVLKLMKEAKWRGVKVKLIIGGSRDNLLIAESAEAARSVALDMGLECKWLTSIDVRGSHSKFIVADDFVLSGSHNWSASAFTNQIQDSLLVKSSALAAYCQSIFYQQWNRK